MDISVDIRKIDDFIKKNQQAIFVNTGINFSYKSPYLRLGYFRSVYGARKFIPFALIWPSIVFPVFINYSEGYVIVNGYRIQDGKEVENFCKSLNIKGINELKSKDEEYSTGFLIHFQQTKVL